MKASTALGAPPGVRVPIFLPESSSPMNVHLYCTEGTNASAPTVLFLHGVTGSCLDAEWVRGHPAVTATGARFCAIDRPGYGWSDSYDADLPPHFGTAATLVKEALSEHLAPSALAPLKLVLMFHSLGGYHAGALRAALAIDQAFDVRGVVAVDAMVPAWSGQNTSRPAAACDVDAPLSNSDANIPFWKLVRDAEPTGLVRIMYVSGVGGYNAVVLWFPRAVQPALLGNAMRAKYPRAILTERQRWAINCGYASAGMGDFAAVDHMEVLTSTVAGSGLDNDHWRDYGPGEPHVSHTWWTPAASDAAQGAGRHGGPRPRQDDRRGRLRLRVTSSSIYRPTERDFALRIGRDRPSSRGVQYLKSTQGRTTTTYKDHLFPPYTSSFDRGVKRPV